MPLSAVLGLDDNCLICLYFYINEGCKFLAHVSLAKRKQYILGIGKDFEKATQHVSSYGGLTVSFIATHMS